MKNRNRTLDTGALSLAAASSGVPIVGEKRLARATWSDLTEPQPEITLTPIERMPFSALPPMQQHWIEKGFVVLENFIPHDVIDAYAEVRARLPKDRSAKNNYYGGWNGPTPYMHCPELLNLATYHELQHALHALIGDPMGLHLALTGWVSTERMWHQDSYLNPDFLWSWYAAAWIALDDITPDSGPFEMVAGSHKWNVMRRSKLFEYLPSEVRNGPHWPSLSQFDVGRICEQEMARNESMVTPFIPKKGDVLIWHSNLVHRGSMPTNPEAERRALICHYSALTRRLDMDKLKRNPENGMLYFDLPTDGAVHM